MTVLITAEFTGRSQYSCINQICEDCVEIIGKLMVITYVSANVMHS